MDVRKKFVGFVSATILFCVFSGCTYTYRERVVHSPILASNVPKLVKGTTTRSEVMQWFGVPDLQADGSRITLYPESPMGQYRLHGRARLIEQQSQFGKKGSLANPLAIDPDIYEKIARLRPYSSIDDAHVALLYEEMYYLSQSASRVGKDSHLRNQLLIFINKATDIVDDFAYREEFRADEVK